MVPNAKVTVENVGTSGRQISNHQSRWRLCRAQPQRRLVWVTVEAPTFKTIQQKNVEVEVATDVRIDMKLQPGAVSEVMEVTGEQPLVETKRCYR